jgi:2-methylcitrate dehydratase PrpD
VALHLDGNPDQNTLAPQRFVVELADGRRHEVHLEQVYGHPEVPLTAAENEDKFRRCVGYASRPLPAERADALVEAVAAVETLDDASSLAALTVSAPGMSGQQATAE